MPLTPRPMTPTMRQQLGIPARGPAPYPWAFASLAVGTVCLPLLIAGMWKVTAAAAALGWVGLPLARWFEGRDLRSREQVYRNGAETVGTVLDVEPAGHGRRDHIVRLEFRTDRGPVKGSVVGSPLARRGLAPGDQVAVFFSPRRPTKCLILRKTTRDESD